MKVRLVNKDGDKHVEVDVPDDRDPAGAGVLLFRDTRANPSERAFRYRSWTHIQAVPTFDEVCIAYVDAVPSELD